MNKQKILVVGEIFSPNLGDYAIYDSMKNILLSKNTQVTPLDISGREGFLDGKNILSNEKSKILLNSIKKKILNKQKINRVYSYLLWEFFLKRKLRVKWEKLIKENQLIIIGGGQLITDSNANFFYKIKQLILICEKFNKPFVFMGCGVGEGMDSSMILKYSKLINKSNFISFRDYQSFNIFKPHLTDKVNSTVFPDFAFSLNRMVKKNKNDKVLGINIIPFESFKKFNNNLINYNDEIYLKFWLKICQSASSAGYKIKIFTNGHINDYNYAIILNQYLKTNSFYAELYSKPNEPEDLYQQINSLDYVLATRMHAGIIAKALGKKSVTLIWDKKIPNVWKAISMESSTIDSGILNNENPWNIIDKKLNDIDQEKFNKDQIVRDIEKSLDIILGMIR